MPLLDYRFAFKIVEKKKKIEKKKGSLFSYPALQHRGGEKKKRGFAYSGLVRIHLCVFKKNIARIEAL